MKDTQLSVIHLEGGILGRIVPPTKGSHSYRHLRLAIEALAIPFFTASYFRYNLKNYAVCLLFTEDQLM